MRERREPPILTIIACIVILVLLIVAVFAMAVNDGARYREHYEAAVAYLDAKQYSKALEELEQIPNVDNWGRGIYEDAPALHRKAQEGVIYEQAMYYYELGEYHAAYDLWSSIEDFEDSIAWAFDASMQW